MPKPDTFFLIVTANNFIPEQNFDGPATREQIVSDICAGQHEDVEAVLLVWPETCSVIDETKDIMREVLERRLEDDGEITSWRIRNLLEHHLGCRAVADAERELAA